MLFYWLSSDVYHNYYDAGQSLNCNGFSFLLDVMCFLLFCVRLMQSGESSTDCERDDWSQSYH